MSDSQSTGHLARDPQMPSPGDVLNNRYVIREALGEGGFAVVYRADDKTTGAQVAVKVMDPIMSRRDELAQRFLREVETVSRLRHHHTIKVSDKGETANGCLFLVMELLEGVPLDSFLDKIGTVEPERVRQISIQILKSLAEAHSQGVMHRDLKPANIFLVDLVGEDEDFIKVLDFGIAKSLDDEDVALTSTGQVMCSPHYVAPERVADHITVPASDLYSLGVMMIELLEGDVPYDASTPIQIVLQHARIDNPVPMKPETLNGPLGPILQRAVEKRYSQRYQSAREMLTALQELGPIKGVGSAYQAPTRAADVDTHDLSRKMTTADAMAGGLSRDITPPPTLVVSTNADEFGDDSGTQRKSATPLIIALALFLVLITMVVVFYFTTTDGDDDDVAEQTQSERATARTREPRQERPIADGASRVTITTSPENAAIRVGDQFVGTAPVTLPHESFRSFPVEVRAELSSGLSRSVVIQSAEELGEDLIIEFDENDVAALANAGTQDNDADNNSQTNDEAAENANDEQPSSGDSPPNGETGTTDRQRPPEVYVDTTPNSAEPAERPSTPTTPPQTNPTTPKPETSQPTRPAEPTRPTRPAEPTQPTRPTTPTPNTLPDRTPLPPSNTGGYSGSGRDAGGSGGSGGSGYWGR